MCGNVCFVHPIGGLKQEIATSSKHKPQFFIFRKRKISPVP